MSVNPYLEWIHECEAWLARGKRLPLGGIPATAKRVEGQSTGGVLIFAPHPDDECIFGALPLRLAREAGLAVTDIAVTLGSKLERRAGRWQELCNACAFLGWAVECAAEGGLEKISPKGRTTDPANWRNAVEVVRGCLARHRPEVVFVPHAEDWNGTHIGVHHLVIEALAAMPASFSCVVVETEFWAAMDTPNLMVESRAEDVADLVAATSFHVGEVERNPYHVTLPSWMQDNVRRGGELVGGQGGVAPDFKFCTLYRVKVWKTGTMGAVPIPGGALSRQQSAREWWEKVRMAVR